MLPLGLLLVDPLHTEPLVALTGHLAGNAEQYDMNIDWQVKKQQSTVLTSLYYEVLEIKTAMWASDWPLWLSETSGVAQLSKPGQVDIDVTYFED